MLKSAEAQLLRYHDLVHALASLARSSHGVEAVMKVVHQQIGVLFPSYVTMLALREPDGNWLWELFVEEYRYTQRMPFDLEGIIEGVLEGEALSIPDIAAYLKIYPAHARRMQEAKAAILRLQNGEERSTPPAASMLFVPLGVQGERVGVLSIQSYVAGAFDDIDLQLLDLLTQHVVIALENAALREQLERLTRTDTLTGLLNRRAFYQDVPLSLEMARQTGQNLSLMMLDVHKFKHINDTFGHAVGDMVLSTLAAALKEALPAPGVAFRLSGDEFVLLVWEAEDQLDGLTRRIAQALREADWPPDLSSISLQGGVAQPPPGADLDEWLSLADARMYRAKRRRSPGYEIDWGIDFGNSGEEELESANQLGRVQHTG